MPQLASGRHYDTELVQWQRSLKEQHDKDKKKNM